MTGQPRPAGPARVGLVLGAGGRAGVAYHRGVLRAMDSLGVDPRAAAVIVGTSAGSIVGASLRREATAVPPLSWRDRPVRAGLPGRGAVLELARRPREGLNAVLLRPDIRLGQLDLGDAVAALRRAYAAAWPAAPLWLVAVRRADGRRVVFGRPGAPPADVPSAVAASCAVPGYVRPVRIGGVEYVDGGVHSPTNADLLADLDLDLVVVSSPMSIDPGASRLRVDLPVRLRFHRFLRSELWALRRAGPRSHGPRSGPDRSDGGRAALAVPRVVTVEPDQPTARAMGLGMLNTRNTPEIEELALALDRYIRIRAQQRGAAATSALWLAEKGRGVLRSNGVAQMLERRGNAAGIPGLHRDQIRHTSVHHWLDAGGSEGDAMRLFGWKFRQMLSRYAASTADARARQSHRRLGLGDKL